MAPRSSDGPDGDDPDGNEPAPRGRGDGDEGARPASDGDGSPSPSPSSDDFASRLASARGRARKDEPDQGPSPLGYGLRIGVEMVAGVAVGGLVGWALDDVLGTAPILMIVFFFLGLAAGLLNVLRYMRRSGQLSGPDGGSDGK